MRKLICAVICAIFVTHCWGVPVGGGIDDKIWTRARHLTTNAQQAEKLERVRREASSYALNNFFINYGDNKASDGNMTVTCTACKAAVQSARFFLSEGYSEPELLEFIVTICKDMEIMTDNVCTNFVKNVGPEIVVVLNTTTHDPIVVCDFLLVGTCGHVTSPLEDWDVQLPNVPKPPLQAPNLPSDDAPKVRVLHLSDTHIDPKYTEGTAAECNEPLCCRNNSGPLGPDVPRAGRWGAYQCDTPTWTFENALQHAAATHKDLSYIIWTGDLPAHDVWDQDREGMLQSLRYNAAKIREAFPNVTVYPAIGNHDSAPLNSFPGPEIGGYWNISWLYDEVWKEWDATWITSDYEAGTIRRGAFYSTLAAPGLRIISLNMNFCYRSNWWLLLNSVDPSGELAWLTAELQKAEDAKEKVHILGHIPAGSSDCLNTWSLQYIKIITRYEATVVAQFFGHTHKDEFQIYYDIADDKRPVSVAYLGPSITTYTDLNPGYRVYDIDGTREGSSRMVLDHETWIFDLDEANAVGEPNWRKSYQFKKAFSLQSLLPSDLDGLYQKLKTDKSLMDLYYKYYMKESPKGGSCDYKCVKDMLCRIRSCDLYP